MHGNLSEVTSTILANIEHVKLIYAFNGTGKTRLSNEFKRQLEIQNNPEKNLGKKIIYFNSSTEDLFSWGDVSDVGTTLKIKDNDFTKWILKDQGQDINVITYFQDHWNKKINPMFTNNFDGVSFLINVDEATNKTENIKISKGEESGFIWSIFYCLIHQVIGTREESDPDNRDTNEFDNLEYIFVDDPVSSLDNNNIIQLAVDLAKLIKKCKRLNIKFIVTTHNALFYNVLYNECDLKVGYFLAKNEDGSFALKDKKGDSNSSFSYHLHLKSILESAINENNIQKYHFMILRNLYEKTASFLGYRNWFSLLPEDKNIYYKRILNFASHNTLSGITVAEPSPQEKETIKILLKHLIENYGFSEAEKSEK